MSPVTVKQERNNKGIAFVITVLVHLALLLFLFYYVIITPLPPYKLIPVPEIEVEADFGNGVNGTGHVEQSNMGENPNPEKIEKTSSKVSASKQSAQILTNEAEEPSNIKSAKNPTNSTRIDTSSAPQQQQVTPELASVFNKFRHSKGGTPGGDGNSGQAGNAGVPDGTNPGESMGDSQFGYKLNGRRLLKRPNVNADCHEEGTVVLKIVVDQGGNVISATPGEQGSNTTSPCLYEKATEAAKSTKFSPSPDGTPEQQGKMTVKFTVQ
ncbi:MAG: energy transducer TonB [Bacteroidia bacterium]